MGVVVEHSVSGPAPVGRSALPVPVWRLYTLRLAYLILAGGLAVFVWPTVVSHSAEVAQINGVRLALLGGLAAVAVLGLRYPLGMLPVLLFEMTWKVIYLVAFAWPLWSAHAVTAETGEDIRAVLMVVVFVPLIPWRYVFQQYVLRPAERWR
jgi:hypothetical protein